MRACTCFCHAQATSAGFFIQCQIINHLLYVYFKEEIATSAAADVSSSAPAKRIHKLTPSAPPRFRRSTATAPSSSSISQPHEDSKSRQKKSNKAEGGSTSSSSSGSFVLQKVIFADHRIISRQFVKKKPNFKILKSMMQPL